MVFEEMDAHIQRKWEALSRFTQKLLSGSGGAQVAKIILFAAWLKKNPARKAT